MADLHRALGKGRAARVAVVAGNDEGVGRVLGEATPRQAEHLGRDCTRDTDDLGHVDRATRERGEFAALHRDHSGEIVIAPCRGLHDRGAEVEHPAVDRDHAGTEGGVAFSHAQDTGVDRRAAGVGACSFQQPGPATVLDDGSLRRTAVILNDVAEVIAVGVRPGQRQRARGRTDEAVGREGLPQQGRAGGAGGIDRRTSGVDLEESVREVVDAARTFEAQRRASHRSAKNQVIAGITGVGRAEAARKEAVLEVGDDQRAIENLDGTRIGTGSG